MSDTRQALRCDTCRNSARRLLDFGSVLECRASTPLVFPYNNLRATWPIVESHEWCAKHDDTRVDA